MIKIHAFIEKKEEGGKERPPNLVANDRFQAWWPLKVSKAWLPMECSKLGGPWKIPSLVANGMFHVYWLMERDGFKVYLPSTFHPKIFYLNHIPIHFRVLFYHGPKLLFHVIPCFSLTYKLHSYVSFTLIVKLILIKKKFLEVMASHMTMFHGL